MEEPFLDYQACQIKVALMRQELDNFKTFFERLDSAIEKIGVVSSDIKQMLAVHEERIVSMDRKIISNKDNVALAREEFKEEIKELHSRITTVNREVSANLISTENKIIANQDKVVQTITEGQEELKRHFLKSNTSLENRVKILENWRYVLVGIFLVMGVLIGFIINNRVQIGNLSP